MKRGLALAPGLAGGESALLQAMLRCADYGVLVTDQERRDLLCNLRFAQIFGVDLSQTVRSSPEAVRAAVRPRLEDPEDFNRQLDQVYARQETVQIDDLELIRPHQVLLRHTCPIVSESGEMLGRLWTFVDITPLKLLQHRVEAHAADLEAEVKQRTEELKEAQARLVRSEKLSAAGMLAASTAHDIRNILTPLTIEIGALAGVDIDALDAIRLQVNRLSTLAYRLLALSRPTERVVQPTDLVRLWVRVLRLVSAQAETDHVVVASQVGVRSLPVQGDPDGIEQVFVNLFLNALAAMAPVGGRLDVHLRAEGAWAVVSFSDTGPGIDPSVREHLFEPFVTTRQQGTGLGLFSCRQIVQEQGGAVEVASAPGRGARFTVRLPLAPRPPCPPAPLPLPAEPVLTPQARTLQFQSTSCLEE